MPLPFVYPRSEGPGRLTEVASFRQKSVGPSRFQEIVSSAMSITASFPPFRQCRLGNSVLQNDETTLMIFDWTTAEDKTAFQTEQNSRLITQQDKIVTDRSVDSLHKSAMDAWNEVVDQDPSTFIRHHITLPGSAVTPECGYYETATLTLRPEQHHILAASMEKYCLASGDRFSYMAVAVSNDKPSDLVIILGYPSAEVAEIADKSNEHLDAKKINDPLVLGWWKAASPLKQIVVAV